MGGYERGGDSAVHAASRILLSEGTLPKGECQRLFARVVDPVRDMESGMNYSKTAVEERRKIVLLDRVTQLVAEGETEHA